MTDASMLVVPLWGAIATSTCVLCALVGLVAWVLVNFERKEDASEKTKAVWDRHHSLEERMGAQESTLSKVAQDVSYIRGRLEPRT